MPKVKRANIPKMKTTTKVRAKSQKARTTIIRNKDFALERELFKAIRPGLQQTKL